MILSTKNSKKKAAQTCSIRIAALLAPGKKKKIGEYLVFLCHLYLLTFNQL